MCRSEMDSLFFIPNRLRGMKDSKMFYFHHYTISRRYHFLVFSQPIMRLTITWEINVKY